MKKAGDGAKLAAHDEMAAAFSDDEEFDLDNSDDLNRFINKYESMLAGSKEK